MDSEMDESAPQLVNISQQTMVPTTDDFQKVSILYTSGNPNDQELANQLVHYLRGHPQSYQIAMQMYTSYLETKQPDMFEWTKFFCLQIVNDYIESNYSQIPLEELSYIKNFMNSWLRNEVTLNKSGDDRDTEVREEDTINNPSSSLIKHKMAVLFLTFFLLEYPRTWPMFFEDLLQTCNLGRESIDNFLRVLIYICDEIGERDTPFKDDLHKRNTDLKDAMRERNILQLIFKKIQDILVCCCPIGGNGVCLDVEITKSALIVVEKYVSWIDIDLVANNEMFGDIINILNYKEVNYQAIDCIHEIIYKGMLPAYKFHTIEVISRALLFNDKYCSGPLQCTEEDVEYESHVGRLLNTIGLELIKIMTKIAPDTSIEGQCVTTILHKCIEIMINFLACEYDDVSITVTEFAKSYLHALKARSSKVYSGVSVYTDVELYFVRTLLEVVVLHMRFSDDYSFVNDGELEADFQEYRKCLNVIFENITVFNKALVMELVEQYVARTVTVWTVDKSIPFNDVEVACHLFYLLGESLPVEKGYNHFTSPSLGTKMTQVMTAILKADLSTHPHYIVCLYYFEILCRFDKYFKVQNDPKVLWNVIVAFLSDKGIRHPNIRVRSRLAFLFSRFVRSLKDEVRMYSREILSLIAPLLLRPDNMFHNPFFSHDDQLYVYETVCFLVLNISETSRNSNEKANNFKTLLAPLKQHIEMCRSAFMIEQDEAKRAILVEEISHHIAIAGRCSKAFTCRKSMQEEGVVDIFLELMMLFLSLVEDSFIDKSGIDAAVKQYLHRMVICLEQDMLPATPRIFFAFTKVPNPAVINDFMPLLIQMVNRFKNNLYDYLITFHGSLFSALDKALGDSLLDNSQTDENLLRDKLMLRRSYYQFVLTMFNNNLGDIFQLEDAFKFFVKDMLHVLNNETDALLQKSAFHLLRKTMEVWNNENYHDIAFKTFVPPFLNILKRGLLFDSTESSVSSAADEAAKLMLLLYKQNANLLEQKLRTELLFGPPEAEIENFIHLFRINSKGDFKIFRQFLEVSLKRSPNIHNGMPAPVTGITRFLVN